MTPLELDNLRKIFVMICEYYKGAVKLEKEYPFSWALHKAYKTTYEREKYNKKNSLDVFI